MSLTTLLQNIKNTRVYRLVYDGRVLAVRVAMYNVKLEKMEYFDFTLRHITDEELKEHHSKFPALPLLYENGLYFTKEEKEYNTRIQELTDDTEINALLDKAMDIVDLTNACSKEG